MDNVVLSVKNLVTQFRTTDGIVTAVNDVSFDVEKGKILGIVGESGCGKSVTSLSIMRILPDYSGILAGGSVLYDGKDLVEMTEKEMCDIRGNHLAMIFQEPMTALNPVFSIGYQLKEVLRVHTSLGEDEIQEKCAEMLIKVGISDTWRIMKAYPHQLSGGMRQRVMIAMALLCSPSLLIADEPTTALDVTIQAQVLKLLHELIDEFHMAIMFITHDLGVIAEMANDVIVMYAGMIVEQAPVGQLFFSPLHTYTQGLLFSRPSTAKRGDKLRSIPGMVPALKDLPKSGCSFAPRCSTVSDRCYKETPELIECGDNGHKARCWNAQRKAGVIYE